MLLGFFRESLAIAEQLGKLKSAAASTSGKLLLLRAFAAPGSKQAARSALRHMKLDQPQNLREWLLARLVRAAYRF